MLSLCRVAKGAKKQMDKRKNTQFINVFVRPRPLNKEELQPPVKNVIVHSNTTDIIIKKDQKEKKYAFDRVFRETSTQINIFDEAVIPLIKSLVQGINCTLLAYGQTGTGKTYTLNGNLNNKVDFSLAELDEYVGITPRAAVQVFKELKSLDSSTSYTVQVSFLEIYNEELRDLLNECDPAEMKIYENSLQKGSVKVTNLTEVTVLDHLDILRCLQMGLQKRQTALTNLNRHSSRSHSLFTITVTTVNETENGEELLKIGKLNLVDLAGSENIGRSGATDVRAKEAFNINRSLLTLGRVVQALSKKQPFVPYRESKLTRILQDSLGGNTKTTMIATISPSVKCWDETVSTLEYATITRGVEVCPQVNENRTHLVIIRELREDIKTLEKELAAARSGDGFYVSHESFQQLNKQLKDYEDKNKVLTKAELELVEKIQKLNTQVADTENENEKLNKSFALTRVFQERYKEKLKATKVELHETDYLLSYYVDRENELTETTKSLLGVVRNSTNHANIFHSKYLFVTDTSLNNANTAKEISLKATSFFNEIERNTQKFISDEQNNIKAMQAAVDELDTTNNTVVEDLGAISQVLNENRTSWISELNIDGVGQEIVDKLNVEAKLKEFQEKIQVRTEQEVQQIRCDTLATIKENKNLLRKALEVESRLVQNNEEIETKLMETLETLKSLQQSNECNKAAILELNEILNQFSSDTETTAEKLNGLEKVFKEIEQDSNAFASEVRDSTREAGNSVGKFFNKLRNNLWGHAEVQENQLKRVSDTLSSIKGKFSENVKKGLNQMRTSLVQSGKCQENFATNMQIFYDHASESVQTMAKNVRFSTRMGDTPAHNNFTCPAINTPRRANLQTLRDRFKNEINKLNLDDSLDVSFENRHRLDQEDKES